MKYLIPLFLFMALINNDACTQETIPLYSVIPNSRHVENKEQSETGADGILRVSHVSVPSITLFKAKGVSKAPAIIICPGGGYGILAMSHEGTDVAKALNEWGITAVLLKYRLPDTATMTDKSIGPLQDAERAIQLVRENAKKWGIDPSKVGVMGFSAGGHMAASLSVRYKEPLIPAVKHISLRPDFSILIYPVISFTDSLTHKGSRNNLLGTRPTDEQLRHYSNELSVNKNTPPAFLVHAIDDNAVPYQNSMVYYEALRRLHIPAAVKLFKKGGHGFGMYNKAEMVSWMPDLKVWLMDQKVLGHVQ